MNSIQNSDAIDPDNDRDKTIYHSYVLRVWKSGKGILKGYILDPITDESFPLVNIPEEDMMNISNQAQVVWIEPLGCWLGLWKSANKGEKQE